MTAFIIVDLTPIDHEKLTEYSQKAAQTLTKFKGEFLTKGAIDVLHGDSSFSTKVIIQFPSKEEAKSWYQSSEYQAILPIRNKGMKSQFHLVS